MIDTPSRGQDKRRKPIAFDVPDASGSFGKNDQEHSDRDQISANVEQPQNQRRARLIDIDDENIIFTAEEDDIFNREADDDVTANCDPNFKDDYTSDTLPSAIPLFKIFLSALGVLLSLAAALWLDGLVNAMFARNPWLGGLTLSFTFIAVGALIALLFREIFGLLRLRSIASLRDEIAHLLEQNVRPQSTAKRTVSKVVRLIAHRPETAKGRRTLQDLDDQIIDGPDYLALAERELMVKLDEAAQKMILQSAKRVSIVTAVSPRALLDISYVLYEMIRLSRNIAQLYGARPGLMGTFALLKSMATHLAVTGGMAVGEDMFHQLLGQSVVSKLSTRFGEGMINGLMTSRVGIVAMVVARPMPFYALKRPTLGALFEKLRQ